MLINQTFSVKRTIKKGPKEPETDYKEGAEVLLTKEELEHLLNTCEMESIFNGAAEALHEIAELRTAEEDKQTGARGRASKSPPPPPTK